MSSTFNVLAAKTYHDQYDGEDGAYPEWKVITACNDAKQALAEYATICSYPIRLVEWKNHNGTIVDVTPIFDQLV